MTKRLLLATVLLLTAAAAAAQPTLPKVRVKAAVANEAALPTCDAASDGHLRVAVAEATLNYCNGTAWANVGDGVGSTHGDGANCAAGEIPLGVDGSGAAQGCYEPTEADISDLVHTTDTVGVDEIMEEGSGLTKRAQVNFIGASVTCVDNAGATRTDCTLTDADTVFTPTDLDSDYGAETITSDFDFGGGTLQVPNSTTLPATCEVGDAYMDSDATTGQRWYLCESANTWAVQGADNPPGSDTQVIFNDGGAWGADADFVWNKATPALSLGLSDVTTQLILPFSNDAVTPTLAFGDGDSGFYQGADNTLGVALNGAAAISFQATQVFSVYNSNYWEIRHEMPSATNPVFLPNGSDVDTGLGHSAPDQLSLIAGGVEGARLTETGGEVVLTFDTIATAPATCSIGDFYVDTSGAYCACTSTNTWENMTATGTCA